MKKRSLIAAIAMLVVSAIVLTSATFAWFTMGETVTVSSFNASVTEADGLTISADGTNFKSSVSLSDIATAGLATSLVNSTDQMFPVSTNGVSDVYAAHLEGDTVVMDGAADTGKYYDFPLWIKYMGDGTATVTLSGTTITNGDSNASGKDPVKAARLACYALGASDAKPASCTVLIPSATTGEPYNYLTSGTVRSTASLSSTTTDASTITISLGSRQAQKINVRIWLEGEDAQCTDAIAAGGQLAIAMTFTKA